LPFALAREPYAVSASTFGCAFAIAMAEPVFQRRVLDLPARLASSQSRALRIALLFDARRVAARYVLEATPAPDRHLFEELTSRGFGAPLPSGLRDAWPEPSLLDAGRLVGALSSPAFVSALVERFDDDWFRNPKAGAHLANLACAPARAEIEGDEVSAEAPRTLARAFEKVLG
jgi:hypothetical protein